MKKLFCIIIALLFIITANIFPVITAQAESRGEITFLRAGGGGGGGSGGGGSGGGSGSHSGSGSGSYSSGGYYGFAGRQSLFGDIIGYVIIAFILSGSALIFRFRLSKSALNSRKLMGMLDNKDSSWKYKTILKDVKKAFFAIQNAWTELDMTPAKEYMSDGLFENFQSKLHWMKYRNEKNILENIKLIEAAPVSVHDEEDDSLDYVWFYIKGKMVDYTINTESGEKLSGNDFAQRFVEYWKFIRNENGNWVLDKILQEDEKDMIVFQ